MYVFSWKNVEGHNVKAEAWPHLADARYKFMKMSGWDMPDEVWLILDGRVTVFTAGEFMDRGPRDDDDV